MKKLLVVCMAWVAITGCAREELSETFANGYVRYCDSMAVPNNCWDLRGPMTVEARGPWLRVHKQDGGVYLIPRERVIYAGTNEIR